MNDLPPPALVLEATPVDLTSPAPAPRPLFATISDGDWQRFFAEVRRREKRQFAAETNEIVERIVRQRRP